MSGSGGTFFEIFASVVSTMLEPMYVPIEFRADRERRQAWLVVRGFGARIQLPDGFEYKEAEMANCVMNEAVLGDRQMANRNTYAQFAAVEWSNAEP